MRTISQVVEGIIEESPFFGESIAEGIANNSEIARRIKPLVERRLLESVSESAVAMALHRLGKNFRRPEFVGNVLKGISDITLRSSLVEFIFPNTVDIFPIVEAVSRAARRHKDSFVNFSRGLRESLIIVNKEFDREVVTAAGRKHTQRIEGLSAITMRLPPESVAMPGVYYPILKAIAWEGISFVEVMSIDTEFSILFKDADIDRAFSILKRITTS